MAAAMELWQALRAGDVDTVRELAADEDLREAVSEKGYRAIHLVVLGHHVDALRELLEAGADVDARRDDGWTALHHCAAFGKVEMARVLLEYNASLDARDNDGWTALLEACSPDAPEETKAEMIQLLVDKNADVNAQKTDGASPLHLVAASGSVASGEILCDAGAALESRRGSTGPTPLFVAATRGHASFVVMLISRGADPRCQTSRGRDALLSAVEGEHLDVVKVLVASGVAPKRAHFTASESVSDEVLKAFVLFALSSELVVRLRSCAMERYIPDFFDKDITSLEAGQECGDEDLENLGVASPDHREAIIHTLSSKRSSLSRLSQRLSLGIRLGK
ncbi:Ankyrin repeat and protein kinase domain-containing protein 1 [Hondaea fermentalgiana]|uniref:Ankyrin repeat and protein kinase domain-containing protein 1 n=1 Tax=Hondaea fermentalgiana TaxID=2315210 RepID=A0A2R5G307_9STRA|nr:Ankyrin repeat and protein kinase domain-containing protein 1 [Hondaea fermentalgiana]|eukprot:GBG24915.1 Ankyrin repeat and protein kinase domain-containing protein 1 [Hondaea fermentalgiana]